MPLGSQVTCVTWFAFLVTVAFDQLLDNAHVVDNQQPGNANVAASVALPDSVKEYASILAHVRLCVLNYPGGLFTLPGFTFESSIVVELFRMSFVPLWITPKVLWQILSHQHHSQQCTERQLHSISMAKARFISSEK